MHNLKWWRIEFVEFDWASNAKLRTLKSQKQLASHFDRQFCAENIKFVDKDKRSIVGYFEQLIASRVFGGGPIGRDYAKDFDELTKRGIRANMSDAYYHIFVRQILKILIKKEYFILVSKNYAKMPDIKENRAKFGKMIDQILRPVFMLPLSIIYIRVQQY